MSEVLETFLESGLPTEEPATLKITGSFAGEPRGLKDSDIERLAASAHLLKISELDLSKNQLRKGGIEALVASPFLSSLSVLDLSHNRLGAAGVSALASSPSLSSLRKLCLCRVFLGKKGVAALVASPHLPLLETLELSKNDLQDGGVMSLVSAFRLPGLSSLFLDDNQLGLGTWNPDKGFQGLQALVSSPSLASLRNLGLNQNGLQNEGVIALASSFELPQLSSLGLWGNGISDQGAEALAGCPRLHPLKNLLLAFNAVTDRGAIALASSSSLGRLEVLSLAFNAVTEAGVLALASSPSLPRLQNLGFCDHHPEDTTATLEARGRYVRREPSRAWEEETSPIWRLLAYACLSEDEQRPKKAAFLDLAEVFLSEPPSFRGAWCLEHLAGWAGRALEIAAARFPDFPVLSERCDAQKRQKAGLEEALFRST